MKQISKRKKIYLSVITAFIIVISSVLGYSITAKASDLKAVKETLQTSVPASTKSFASEFVTTSQSQSDGLVKNGADPSGTIAYAVSNTVNKNLSTTTLTEEQLQKLNDEVAKTVSTQLSAMHISLNAHDQQMLTAGIQALVISDLYKAISDRGLIDVDSLNTMKFGLEERLAACEELISSQAKSVSSAITNLTEMVNEIEQDPESAEHFSELANEIAYLQEFIKNYGLENISPETLTDLDVIVSSLQKKLDTLSDELSENGVDLSSLGDELNKVKSSISDSNLLTQDMLNSLRSQLELSNSELQGIISSQSTQINSLNTSLNTLSTDFEMSLENFDATQTNTNNIIAAIKRDLGEGSVDERIIDLCNELAEALSADITSINDSINQQINGLNASINATNSSLTSGLNNLNDKVTTIQISMDTLSEEQTDALTLATQNLQAKIDESNQDIISLSSSLSSSTSSLNSLVEGNATDIVSLRTNIQNARTELTEAMESANEEQKAEIEGLIGELDSTLSTLDSSFQIKTQELQVSIENLSEAQTQALTDATSDLQSRIDESNADISSLSTSLSNATINLNGLIEGNATDITALRTNLTNAKTELQVLMESADEEQKEELRGMISDVDMALQTLNSSFATKTLQLEASIAQLDEKQTRALNDATSALQNKIDESNADISSLSSSLSSATESLNGLIEGNTTNITQLQDNLETAKSDLTKQMESADEKQKEELQGMIDAIDDTIVALDSSFDASISSINNSLLSVNSQIATTNTQLEETKTALETAKNNLSGQLSTLSTNLTGAKNDITTLSNTLTTTKNEISALQGNLDTTTETANKNTKDIDTLENSINSKANSSDIDSLNKKIKELEEELENKSELTFTNDNGIPTVYFN